MTRELGTKRDDLIVGEHAVPPTEFVVAIASRPRRDVQVHVRDVLARSHAVVDQQIVAIWTQCFDESSCPAMRLGRHLHSDGNLELVPQHHVQLGNHEHVPARGLIAIEDNEAPLALVEECPLEVSRGDAAKRTAHQGTMDSSTPVSIGSVSVEI